MDGAMVAQRENHHVLIQNRIKKIDSAVSRIDSLIMRIRGDVAPPSKGEDITEWSLCATLNQTPEVLGDIAERINKQCDELNELLF